MLGDPAAFETVAESSNSDDPGDRKMAAYVLGKLGDRRAIPRLQVLLGDPAADVRWNAAIALASLHDASGIAILRGMIDRPATARQTRLSADQSEVAMVSALQALAILKDPASVPAIERVSREDPNLRVREAARKALEASRGSAAPAREKSSVNLERSRAVLVG